MGEAEAAVNHGEWLLSITRDERLSIAVCYIDKAARAGREAALRLFVTVLWRRLVCWVQGSERLLLLCCCSCRQSLLLVAVVDVVDHCCL
jgi:hypothetical protein